MEHEPSTTIAGLPDNARRPLEGDETYVPVVPDETGVHEVTNRSVAMGLLFCALFSMAAAYLALRVGQGIEAAIPIAILAIGLSPLFARRSTISPAALESRIPEGGGLADIDRRLRDLEQRTDEAARALAHGHDSSGTS